MCVPGALLDDLVETDVVAGGALDEGGGADLPLPPDALRPGHLAATTITTVTVIITYFNVINLMKSNQTYELRVGIRLAVVHFQSWNSKFNSIKLIQVQVNSGRRH